MTWRKNLLRIQKHDEPQDLRYEGPAAFFDEPELVPWPGVYANPDGVLDTSKRLRWIEEVPEDDDHSGGWWEIDNQHPSAQDGCLVPLAAEVKGLSKGSV